MSEHERFHTPFVRGLKMIKSSMRLAGGFIVAVAMLLSTPVNAAETFKIAYIDPLSGPFANVGRLGARHFELYAKMINDTGGLNGQMIEILKYDGQFNTKVSVEKVKQAIAAGASIISQGNGSSVAHAITGAVLKYNTRNPGKEVLFFNYAAVDPALTNDKCNFWHFRFDANADIKMKALVNALVKAGKMRKVYIIGQNYSFGQAVGRAAVRELKAQAPNVKIVGRELHPVAKIKDFSPYINKIRASGADTIITGNWGNDMMLLIMAGNDAGLKAQFATYYAGGLGSPQAFMEKGIGTLVIQEGSLDETGILERSISLNYRKKYIKDREEFGFPRVHMMFEYLLKAAEKAGSNNPVKIAKAMEGLEVHMRNGRTFMRKKDHQIFMSMFVTEFSKESRFDAEGTGMGWKTFERIPAEDTMISTTCNMKRP